jgi:hypothetical protein
VLTKADKLSRGRLDRQLSRLEEEGELADLPYLPFSSETGLGRGDLLQWIQEMTAAEAGPGR